MIRLIGGVRSEEVKEALKNHTGGMIAPLIISMSEDGVTISVVELGAPDYTYPIYDMTNLDPLEGR